MAKDSRDARESSSQDTPPGGGAPARFIVGVGISAGGLDSLERFLVDAPADIPAAFVVIARDERGTTTDLPERLQRRTPMRVAVARDGDVVAAGMVYVAANRSIRIEARTLRVDGGDETSFVIDPFFASLARAAGEDAIGVLLSSTGNDGALGLAEISAAGGLCLAQPIDSPSATMAAASSEGGQGAYVTLAPEKMLRRLLRHLGQQSTALEATVEEQAGVDMKRIIAMLRQRTGHDFSAYKKSTMWRRIQRRMAARRLTSFEEYAEFLALNPSEIDTLFRELLIRVTSFFRDAATFVALRKHLRGTLAHWDDLRVFRAWVPACATGEEAYSLAILLKEICVELNCSLPIQIFATDLDPQAVDRARSGKYSHAIAADVGSERLERFFSKEESGYRINKDIRELIIFAVQNATQDPPFTHIDLVSCRNLFIYLEADLQRQVLNLFSYALRPGGLLLLGSSENAIGFDAVFTSLDKEAKIFQRREVRIEPIGGFPEFPAARGGSAILRASQRRAAHSTSIAEQLVLTHLAPPSVLTNERGDISYFHGRTGQFLEPAAGEPDANLFSMLREGLRLEVPAAIRQAGVQKEVVVRSGLQVKSNDGFVSAKITVRPVLEPPPARGMFLVSFEIEPEQRARKPERGGDAAPHDRRVSELERELQQSRENLRGTIEELETSNEELKSTNEELQSTNEELQSANEELETSREEMQSLYEELQMVNTELEKRNRDLSEANDEMQNLLNSTAIATIFLDNRLAIKRFTSEARKIFSLIDTDIGRPISDLTNNIRYDGLVDDAQEVLRTLVFQERVIETKEGVSHLMRIMPHRTAGNRIDGLVLTFVDIDHVRSDGEGAEPSWAEALLDALPDPIATLDADLRVITANRAFCDVCGKRGQLLTGRALKTLADGLLASAELNRRLRRVLSGTELCDLQVSGGSSPKGRQFRLSARALKLDAARPLIMLRLSATNSS